MEKFRQLFKGVEDPRTGNATCHDFCEMLTVAVFSSLSGGQTCVDMADCAENKEAFLRQFMRLEHGLPSRDTFSRLFRMIEPEPFAKAWLEYPGNAETMLSHQNVGRGHGRKETRTATVCHDIGPLQDARQWPGLAAISKIESVRVSEGRTQTKTRTCIMSRKTSARDFLKAVRNRRAIENRLHWVLDVQMREDDL